ncbi:hypothetical protein [Marinobacter sp.]|uniref:hypothetical protein n=1 Tax=Marinobacter sp. TaxID=50741 RepID=UPI002B2717FE|nr:hypothetical protein [Marinobacter sp.]
MFTVAAALETSHLLLVLIIPVLALGWASFQRFGLLKKPNAIVALSNDTSGLTCQLANGRHLPVTVTNASFLSSKLLILQLKPSDRKSGSMIAIITGNMGAPTSNTNDTAFRRLRMLLRAGSPEPRHNTPSH